MATAVEDTSLQRNALMGYVRPHPFAEMRESGIRGLLVCCADYRCNHSIAISGDQWSDDLRLSDIEPRFVCRACGKRGADVRPDFNWGKSRPA